jgi:hypothetical protein
MRPTQEHPPREIAHAMGHAQDAAVEDRIEIRSMQPDDTSAIVVTATCGPS